MGSGFSEGQDLLVRFGDGTKPVRTELVNPHNLRCTLPPSDSARCVYVTLHLQGTSIPEIHNEDVLFTYEDVENELSVGDYLRSYAVLIFSPASSSVIEC